jgi:hypothetical protein
MTNTLHRYGTAESFADDYVVIGIPAKGAQSGADPMPALKRFLEIAREYHPVSIGDAIGGGSMRPTKHHTMWQHFFDDRPTEHDFDKVFETVSKPTTYSAVFDKRENAEAFVERLAQEKLGLSINVSSSVINGLQCCKAAGVARHSVAYSLGFEGIPDNLPNRDAMMLSTMCGHGMISLSFAKKMIDYVKENRLKPDKAVAALGRFCSCGIFNPSRAKRIIEDARRKTF